MGNQTTTTKPAPSLKASELDKFRLFYEFVADDTSSSSSKNTKRRTISRNTPAS
jgi:hypothetical protein